MSELERPGQDAILPSLGKPYKGAIPGGLVSVYAMRTTEEKLFAGLTKATDFENVIDRLIVSCSSIPKELKPSELYVGDRTYLMMQIRAASYGIMYGFQASCQCRAKWDHSIDITKDLEVKELDDTWEDPFTIELPYSKDRATLRLYRGRDERRVIDFIDRSTKKLNIKNPGDPGYIYRMALHVVGVESQDGRSSIGGVDADPAETLSAAMIWVESLYAPDSSAIRDEIESRTPGIILNVQYECPKCGTDISEPLPVSPNFFRATSAVKVRTTARASAPAWR